MALTQDGRAETSKIARAHCSGVCPAAFETAIVVVAAQSGHGIRPNAADIDVSVRWRMVIRPYASVRSVAQARWTRDGWIDAALHVLLNEGPDAVAVQPIARRLGATKGSFYWHFSSRDELLGAALARWEVVATDDVIAEIEASPGAPAEKIKQLFAHVTASSEQHPGQLLLLGGAGQPDVAAQHSTNRRRSPGSVR